MIDLTNYRIYWENMVKRLPGLTSAMAVTIDDEMGKKIQRLPIGSTTLFFMPPTSESITDNPDAYTEKNLCVIFVMQKYDTQRMTAIEVLEQSQKYIEGIKEALLNDMAMGCPVLRIDVGSLSTMPETKFFAGFAGWSLGFNILHW